MSENTVVAAAWLAVAAIVLGMASCTYGVTASNNQAETERARHCFEIGGSWEMGWSGKWCNRAPHPNADAGERE